MASAAPVPCAAANGGGLLAAGKATVLMFVFVRFLREFRVNPNFDLEPDYVIRKGISRRIQWYTLRTEILPTFHTRVDRRSLP